MGRPLREVMKDPGVLEDLLRDPEGFKFKEAPDLLITMVSWPTHARLNPDDMNSEIVRNTIPSNFLIYGPMYHLLEIFTTTMNFTYKQVVPPDVSWGVRSDNGSWSGMMRQVVHKEVDVGLGPFKVINTRAEDTDMTAPFFFDTLSLMVARGSAAIDPWGFLMPLTPTVWMAFFIALFTVIIVHMILDYCDNQKGSLISQFGRALFQYFQPPIGHALAQSVWRSWHRPLMGSWVVLSLLFNSSYDGTLRSLMSLRHIPHPIQTIREAVDDTSRKIIVEHRTSFTDVIGRVPSGDVYDMDQAGKAGRYVDLKMMDFMVYSDLVNYEGHVQIFDVSTSLKYFAEHFSLTGRCDFYIADELFIPSMYSMVVQKHSPLTAAFNARILRVIEAGLYNHWVVINSTNITACANPPMKVATMDPIGLGSIWGVGVIWAVGITLALIVLLIETINERFFSDGDESTGRQR